ncbi:acyl-CoA thioesterase [Cerasicoccus maritimus]|uniref:acyl-CoA thioesterase n=1 Tax=Cerasicoccus maritimus TaxID=490089 RepID=UPI0028526920|nr:thioesterase family protein [Cerasicoccus maritimus]
MPEPVFEFRSHVYFDELDALWVLHHSRYLMHLERAQQAFFQHLLGVPDFNAKRDEDIYVVVRNLELNYRTALRDPGPVLIRYRVSRIRAAGVSMPFEFLSGDGETLYCDGVRTVCKLGGQTHQPTEWSPAFRAALDAWAG